MLTNTKSPVTHSIYRANLKKKIALSQEQIRAKIHATGSNIVHRTQAINAKRPYQTYEEEQAVRQDLLAEQMRIWRRTLPQLIHQFSRIPGSKTSKKHQA